MAIPFAIVIPADMCVHMVSMYQLVGILAMEFTLMLLFLDTSVNR